MGCRIWVFLGLMTIGGVVVAADKFDAQVCMAMEEQDRFQCFEEISDLFPECEDFIGKKIDCYERQTGVMLGQTPEPTDEEILEQLEKQIDELVEVENQKYPCRKSLECWAERHQAAAANQCFSLIEKSAKYDFEWTNSWTESRFSQVRWAHRKRASITYVGDKIKMQNGIGNWVRMIYECDYDYLSGSVVDLRIERGRIH